MVTKQATTVPFSSDSKSPDPFAAIISQAKNKCTFTVHGRIWSLGQATSLAPVGRTVEEVQT